MQVNLQLSNKMDSARAYDKYLTARVRVERLNVLLSKHRHVPLNRLSNNRLPAGGRLSETFANWPIPNLSRHAQRSKSKECNCQDVRAAEPAEREPRHQSRFKCKCKHPVLVVPSTPRLECNSSEAAGPNVRFSKCPLRQGIKKLKKPVSCEVEPLKSSTKCPSIELKSCTSKAKMEAISCSLIEPCSSKHRSSSTERTEAVRHISFEEKAEPLACQEKVHCADCNQIPQISLQLTTLMKKLEDQVACEIKQKEELNAINDQLKQLSGTMTNLNDKCKFLETETKRTPQEVTVKCEDDCKLCHKPSSLCQFCKNKDLPILSSLHSELFKLMGKRLFTEVALTILLRADNVYHVNVRDLETGKVLGCLLVNDRAIKEANCLGLFQEILTFCVIDVRSSTNTRDAIFGGINFEFVSDQRLSGGNSSQSKTCFNRRELFEKLHNPVMNLKINQATSKSRLPHKCKSQQQITSAFKSKLSVSQARLQIESIDSSLILADEETQYPVRSIKIISLTDSSSEESEVDRRSAS